MNERVERLNRYRRGLETCPQANLVQNVVHTLFTSYQKKFNNPKDEYDSAPGRKYTAHFCSFSPVSVNLSFHLTKNFLKRKTVEKY